MGAGATTEQAIVSRVAEAGPDWFPGLGHDPTVHLRLLSSRPRAQLYAVTVGADAREPQVLAKVRRDAAVPVAPSEGGRPTLSTSPLGAAALTALEYDRLCATAEFTAGDLRFGAIRPLDHLVERHTILMDFVTDETLRQVLLRRTRLHRGRGRWDPADRRTWQRVGAWLALFQTSVPTDGLPARQQERRAVVDQIRAYGVYLAGRTAEPEWQVLAEQGAEVAAAALPERLPMAVGHGDYAPRNMFLGADDRLTVFDPLGRWAVPVYEDLSRFLVGVRLLGLQLHSRGAAYPAAWVETVEREVVRGHGGGTPAIRLAPLRCYELLLLLDKWSALLSEDPRSGRARLRMASTRRASGFVRGQAERLLELARRGE